MTRTTSTPARRRLLAFGAFAAVSLLITGCGSGSDSVNGVTTTPGAGSGTTAATTPTDVPATEVTDPGTAADTTTAAAEPAPTNTDPVTDPAGPTAPAAVLTAIRYANRGSYDRVVFDFSGPIGGYTVQYVDALTEDPTGDPVELAGGAVIAVSIQGATMNNAFQTSDTTPLTTYGGPKRVSPNLPGIKEVADAGDFEAVLSFGIGVDHKAGFKVLKLSNPQRLVVDVAH